MQTIQTATDPARMFWQPDLFSRARREPMQTLWCDRDGAEVARLARRLRPESELLVWGEGDSDAGPNSSEWRISLWLRYSTNLELCALCVTDEATADWEPPARRGRPKPYLLYRYPTSRNLATLARWLVADYLDSGARQIDTIEQRGAYDLSGIVEDWD